MPTPMPKPMLTLMLVLILLRMLMLTLYNANYIMSTLTPTLTPRGTPLAVHWQPAQRAGQPLLRAARFPLHRVARPAHGCPVTASLNRRSLLPHWENEKGHFAKGPLGHSKIHIWVVVVYRIGPPNTSRQHRCAKQKP